MKAQFLIHNDVIANNVGIAIRNNWQSMKQQGEVLEVVIRHHKSSRKKPVLITAARLRSKINYILKTEAI